jgi:amidase
MDQHLAGRSASELAELVRSRSVTAAEVVRAHLDRILAIDSTVGAFQVLCPDQALADAAALDARDNLDDLPLAGVPIAIKDHVDVVGLPTRNGSIATDPAPKQTDTSFVTRLRDAGAVIVGKTRVPEMCGWATTDSAYGVTRSPWDLRLASGGSSGGSAAAVSSGMVPLAHGSDGGGSIRIPSSACGLFGLKPGLGTIPLARPDEWHGLAAHGPIATTVADVALGLAVMAQRPELATVAPVERSLRIAMSVKPVMSGTVEQRYLDAVTTVAGVLTDLGHTVTSADPDYGSDFMLTAGVRGMGGIAQEAAGLSLRRLERRTVPGVMVGRAVERFGLIRQAQYDAYYQRMVDFFTSYDLLITPTVAFWRIEAEGWSRRSWIANLRASMFAGFTPQWNVAGMPAAAMPVRAEPDRVPPSVQIAGPRGAEGLILSVAQQIEAAHPWQRHPPRFAADADLANA